MEEEVSLDELNAIKEATKEMILKDKDKSVTLCDVVNMLKSAGFSAKAIVFSIAEIQYQLAPWGRKMNKLSHFKQEMKARFSRKHLKENQAQQVQLEREM